MIKREKGWGDGEGNFPRRRRSCGTEKKKRLRIVFECSLEIRYLFIYIFFLILFLKHLTVYITKRKTALSVLPDSGDTSYFDQNISSVRHKSVVINFRFVKS